MRHHCLRPIDTQRCLVRWVRPILAWALVLSLSGIPAFAEECPEWSFSGSITTGDGSTMPGKADLWSTCCPAPTGYYGSYSQGETITISGGGNVGNSSEQWYAISGGYFWSPIGGSMDCTRPEGSPCGTCTGSIDLKLYASQGAIAGTVRVIPEREEGLAGIPVTMSRDPDGGSNPTYTDEMGHFEFRAKEGLARSNNWGVGVDADYSPWPHSGPGEATYYLGSNNAAVDVVTVRSSKLAEANLVIRNTRCEDPEMRCNSGGSPGAGGPNPPAESAGEPVNVITGNVFFDQTDFTVAGVQGLAFVRSYNSKNAYYNVPTRLSRGWTHSYSRTLTFPDSISIDFRGDDGVPLYYQDVDGDNIFDAALPATERTRVVRDGDQYRREFPGGAYEVYDTTGRLTRIVDASGNATILDRNPSGLLTQITDPGGRYLSLSYDDRDRLSRLEAGSQIVASYDYDQSNLLGRVSYPDGSGYLFTCDSIGQVLRVDDASGRPIESHTYGSYGLAGYGLTSEIADGQEKLTFTYEPWRTTVTDAEGNSTIYDWRWVNALRRVTKIANSCASCGGAGADSQQWTYDETGRIVEYLENDETLFNYTYDAEGRVAAVSDVLLRETTYTYDDQDRPLTVATPGGGLLTTTYSLHGPLTVTEKVTETSSRITHYSYTSRGQVAGVEDPRGKTTSYEFDLYGDLLSITDPLQHTTTFSYDEFGRRTGIVDARDRSTTIAYDPRGRIIRVTRPNASFAEFTYDLGGRLTSAIDPLERASRYTYDHYGRLAGMIDPMGGAISYEYDAMGRVTSLSDPKKQKTTFEYDPRGRLTKTIDPRGEFESLTYDVRGLLETKTDRNDVVTTYSYDALKRLVGRAYSDGTPAMTYTYDAAGRLATAANGSDSLSWDYDLVGQVVTEISNRNGSTVNSTYDLAGNRVGLSLDGALFASSSYDDAGRITAITRGTNDFSFAYDEVNRRTSMAYPNGVTTSYSFDSLDQLTGIDAATGPTTLWSIGYTYDPSGNRKSKAAPEFTEIYSYDRLSRLTGVERTGNPGNWVFEYDSADNRTVAQHNTDITTSSHDETNRLISETGGGNLQVRGTLDEPGRAKVNGEPARMLEGNVFEATIPATTGTNTFTVEATDLSGNATTQSYEVDVSGADASYLYDANGNLVQKAASGSTWGYEWNAENQLTRVTRDGVEIATLAYDGLGRRVEKIAGGLTFAYVYDGFDILRKTVTDGVTTTINRHIHGPGFDEPLAREEEASGALSFYHADGLGSIVKMTDQTGAVVHATRYDAWGILELGGGESGYAFTGREWDPEINLYYYRARYYDPTTGRFIGEDPMGMFDGPNKYAYVLSNPTNYLDPEGEAVITLGVAALWGGAILISAALTAVIIKNPSQWPPIPIDPEVPPDNPTSKPRTIPPVTVPTTETTEVPTVPFCKPDPPDDFCVLFAACWVKAKGLERWRCTHLLIACIGSFLTASQR